MFVTSDSHKVGEEDTAIAATSARLDDKFVALLGEERKETPIPAPSTCLTRKRAAISSLIAAAPKKKAYSYTLSAKQVEANIKRAAIKAKNAALKAASTPILATRRLAASSARA